MSKISKIILVVEGEDNIEIPVDDANVTIDEGIHYNRQDSFVETSHNGNRRIQIDAWKGNKVYLDSETCSFGFRRMKRSR